MQLALLGGPVARVEWAHYRALMRSSYAVVVVGGGHAGCEAAAAAARLGVPTALVSFSLEHVGRLSCNPAIGGLAKGCLVREIDALGGLMAKVADATTLQFRRLNTRKGLAVQSSRAQVDIHRYPSTMRAALEAIDGLDLIEAEVAGVVLEDGRVAAVELADGSRLQSECVILTTGTFLSAVMHQGVEQSTGGRVGESSAVRLAEDLKAHGLRLGRLKTGTPPRLDGRTIDWEATEVQTTFAGHFSFRAPSERLPEVTCTITWTTPETHEIIRRYLHTSAMYSGQITGVGPRYCPSIEDKVVRFPDRERHQVFLEPEGLDTNRVYVNGISTSLSQEGQRAFLATLPGLDRAEVIQYGYAVEYDYSNPLDLDHGLQHKKIRGLYLAGQINGTSGYEEAAAQGLVAGISAARGEPFVLGREEAYIGVLIDDLVSRGVGGEPYRMFSSRAEHRLLLREDNADRRLTPKGRELGLIEDEDWKAFCSKREAIEEAMEALVGTKLTPNKMTMSAMATLGLGSLKQPATAEAILRRPEANYAALTQLVALPELGPLEAEQVETDVKYAGYLRRERGRAAETARLTALSLEDLDYAVVPGLSVEVRERLARAQPPSLGAAARLPGVTPAAVTVLASWLARRSC